MGMPRGREQVGEDQVSMSRVVGRKDHSEKSVRLRLHDRTRRVTGPTDPPSACTVARELSHSDS